MRRPAPNLHEVRFFSRLELPFWYALDANSVDVNTSVDLGNNMRIAQINGRAGVPAPARAW